MIPNRHLVQTDVWGQNGFENRTDSTLTFTDGTRTLSVQPAVTSFRYWMGGDVYTSTGATVVITDVEGLHAVYFDGATLTALANPTAANMETLVRDKALVSVLYWDATNNEGILVGDERHGKVMSPETHLYLHKIFGLAFLSGLGLNTMDVDGSGNDATAAQFGVDAGAAADEDITLTISAVVSTTGLPVYHLLGAGADWRRTVTAGYPVRTFGGTSATRLAWNEFTGGAWQLSEVASGDYVLYHVFASNDIDSPMISVMGQSTYANQAAARAGAQVEIQALVLNYLVSPELRPIATVIYQTVTTYTNDVKGRVRSTDEGADFVDWRSETISRVVLTTSDHSALTGILQAASGVTNGHISDAAQTIAGVKTMVLAEPIVDKGTVSSGTVTFAGDDGTYQKVQVGGAFTIAFSDLPASAAEGMLVTFNRASFATITLPSDIAIVENDISISAVAATDTYEDSGSNFPVTGDAQPLAGDYIVVTDFTEAENNITTLVVTDGTASSVGVAGGLVDEAAGDAVDMYRRKFVNPTDPSADPDFTGEVAILSVWSEDGRTIFWVQV